MNGKRPVFVDDMKSIFFFPYLHIRFVEIPPAAMAGADPALPAPVAGDASDRLERRDRPSRRADLEIDEDFLRRVREA